MGLLHLFRASIPPTSATPLGLSAGSEMAQRRLVWGTTVACSQVTRRFEVEVK